jgi:hypothetical protein
MQKLIFDEFIAQLWFAQIDLHGILIAATDLLSL